MKKRALREQNEPEYNYRVDKELSQDRVNFILFLKGQDFEHDPQPVITIGDYQIISYNTKTNSIDLVTLTHDTRAPEIERFEKSQGQNPAPERIDKAYDAGGFNLMRQTIEDATGLAIDFEFKGEDSLIKKVIDNCFGGLNIDVPFDFTTERIYIDNVQYPGQTFSKGPQKMDGLEMMKFIKGTDAGPYDKTKERHPRQHLAFEAMMDSLKNNFHNPFFLKNILGFLKDLSSDKDASADFDLKTMLIDNFLKLVPQTPKLFTQKIPFPNIRKTLFVVDISSGDGGVHWVSVGEGGNDSEIRNNLSKEGYTDINMEIPGGGDPNAPNLVNSYWPSVRSLVKQTLMS